MKTKRKAKAEKREKRRMSAGKRANEFKAGGSRYLKLPDGAKTFGKPKPDEEIIADIVPYTCSDNCTKFVGNQHESGDLNFERTIYVHGYCIGPQKDSCVCAAKTFGKKCYPCEWINKNPLPMDATKADKDARSKLYAKERNIWNLRVTGEEEKGCQILDQSVRTFGESIFTKIKAAQAKASKTKNPKDKKRAEQLDNFADPETGLSLRITPKSKPMGDGKDFVSLESVEFTERDDEVGDEWVEKAHCLDDLIECPDYADIKEKFLAGMGDEEAPPKDEEEGDSDDDELPEAPCEKGDTVEFKHKGKTLTGKCVKVDEEEALVTVKTKAGTLLKIDFDDVIPNEEDKDEDEDQDGDGDEDGEEDDESGDDEDVDEDDADEEDDEEGGVDDEDGEGDEEDEDEPGVVKGSAVTWVSEKSGRKLSGKVTSVNAKNGVALVQYDATKKPIAVDIDLLTVAGKGKKDEEITTLRAGKKGGKVPAKKPKRKMIDGDDDF